MTAPLDGELAWAIAAWAEPDLLNRGQIEGLARHLTEAGFAKPKVSKDFAISDITALTTKLRSTVDEFLKGTSGSADKAAS